jgi:hypothetical protein
MPIFDTRCERTPSFWTVMRGAFPESCRELKKKAHASDGSLVVDEEFECIPREHLFSGVVGSGTFNGTG